MSGSQEHKPVCRTHGCELIGPVPAHDDSPGIDAWCPECADKQRREATMMMSGVHLAGILRDVLVDNPDLCDKPDTCECSAARGRRALTNLGVEL